LAFNLELNPSQHDILNVVFAFLIGNYPHSTLYMFSYLLSIK